MVDPNNADSEKSNLLDHYSDFLDKDRSSSIIGVDRVQNIEYTSSDVDRVDWLKNLLVSRFPNEIYSDDNRTVVPLTMDERVEIVLLAGDRNHQTLQCHCGEWPLRQGCPEAVFIGSFVPINVLRM
ncbi:hypothetical protein TELCIR_18995 [Teladorsagia circumcincta]|uniref:Uncharacterized protein n=1 Tax=Teladorsagia circumcincta TaxID=45464 RepID=A0A2G9TNJ5_TELCI|nr:hypothetical protein TELCIR_18995 [Teladorsagia circumcincta]